MLEVGVGEATTMAGVLADLGEQVGEVYGFDLSWSRVAQGQHWLRAHGQHANLFVGDLFQIPLADNSMDMVYSSHSLEPNGGREKTAIAECLRVARDTVVLVEPLYELASPDAQVRMRHHGYICGLRDAAEHLSAHIVDYRLLEYTQNPLNPSGVLLLRKSTASKNAGYREVKVNSSTPWRCPLTGAALDPREDIYFATDVGIAYPILRGVPLLRPEHAVVASQIIPGKISQG